MGEQDLPLAPIALRLSSEENGESSIHESKRVQRHRKGIICCGCCAATTVIISLIMIILTFTTFKVKSPKVTFHSVKIVGLDLVPKHGGLTAQGSSNSGLNMSFVSDVSLKNPNSASFKFTNATTQLYYGGVVIGDVKSPPGNVGAQKTIHMNVTIITMVDTVARVSRFPSDLFAGQMPIESYTYIHGRVNVMNVVKKHVDVKLNCTMTVVISSQSITGKVCKRTVHI